MDCIYQAVFASPFLPDATPSNPNPTVDSLAPMLPGIVTDFNSHLVRARQRKEANGYPLLGMFSLCIAKELTKIIKLGQIHQTMYDCLFTVLTETVISL